LLDAKHRKITTYAVSIAAPTPLIVDTRMLFGDTNGSPYLKSKIPRYITSATCVNFYLLLLGNFIKIYYQAERRQLRSVMLYGTPENSSVDLFRMILQKVGL
jgi:hypothetical protein